jgi:hypothetical protein
MADGSVLRTEPSVDVTVGPCTVRIYSRIVSFFGALFGLHSFWTRPIVGGPLLQGHFPQPFQLENVDIVLHKG